MKTRGGALTTHQGQVCTTLAWCWKVTRSDSAVFGFTSTDVDLTISGVTYFATTGFTPTAIADRSDLSVPNLEVIGLLSSSSITEADLLAGLWDGATIEIFEVNYTDTSMGIMSLRSGTLGDVSAGRVAFQAEMRGLMQKLQQPIGEVFSPTCAANLGDARCKVALGPYTNAFTVTTATSRRAFTASALGGATDYYGAGLVRWLTGPNAGRSMEVLDFTTGGIFSLVLPMAYDIAVGHTGEAVAGCRKRHQRTTANPSGISDCKDKFNNVFNFRGHPNVPGGDRVLGSGALTQP